MMINENILISVEIQKDLESKKLVIGVKFDKKASNVSSKGDTLVWYPTCDEINFIVEVFDLLEGSGYPEKVVEKPHIAASCPEEIVVESSQHSSEMRIPPVEDDRIIEGTENLRSSRLNDFKKKETIYLDPDDEKKIEELLSHKKPTANDNDEVDSMEKTLVDKMFRKKRKNILKK